VDKKNDYGFKNLQHLLKTKYFQSELTCDKKKISEFKKASILTIDNR